MNIHTSRVYKHTGYDVTIYFQSEVIDVWKRRKWRLRRFPVDFLEKGLNWIAKFQMLIGDNWPQKSARYDITSCFRSAPKCKYTAQKWCVNWSGQPKSWIIRPLFKPHSPNVAKTSTPTYSTATLDRTSPATSDRHLPKFEKAAKNAACAGFGSNFSDAAFCLPHELVGILFRSISS